MIIAELGQVHDGSLGTVHSFIDALAETGIDAVKFQTHIAEAESSIYEPFRVKFSKQDKTRFDYWKRMEFTLDQWLEIKDHCDERGLLFISSPFSNTAVDLLEEVGIQLYKIGSGEVNNFLLLERIARTKKDLILSSGMSSFNELDKAIEFLENRNVNFSILQCTTAYPTTPEQWGLNVIGELKNRYPDKKIGFSDHSGDIYACLAAAVLGAEIFEFHVTFHKKAFGPDTLASITIDDVPKLVKGIKEIKHARSFNVNKADNTAFTELKGIFEKSLAVNKDLKRGHVLTIEDLEAKKPKGYGLNAEDYELVLGRSLNKDLNKWSFLTLKDLV